MEVIAESAMHTPDRLWRVEVVRRRGYRTRWYRIVHGDDEAVLDRLSITAVERILTRPAWTRPHSCQWSTTRCAHSGSGHYIHARRS